MTAPDIETLYMVEDAVEPAIKKVLQSLGFTASIQREAEPQEAPYLNIQLVLGAAMNQIKLHDGGAYQSAWNATLRVQVVTKRHDDRSGAGPTEHSRMRAKLRLAMQYGQKRFTESVLPYHALTEVIENGSEPQVDDGDGLDRSVISFALKISIRSNAWP